MNRLAELDREAQNYGNVPGACEFLATYGDEGYKCLEGKQGNSFTCFFNYRACESRNRKFVGSQRGEDRTCDSSLVLGITGGSLGRLLIRLQDFLIKLNGSSRIKR